MLRGPGPCGLLQRRDDDRPGTLGGGNGQGLAINGSGAAVGAFKGATGTITGKSISNTKTAITIAYS